MDTTKHLLVAVKRSNITRRCQISLFQSVEWGGGKPNNTLRIRESFAINETFSPRKGNPHFRGQKQLMRKEGPPSQHYPPPQLSVSRFIYSIPWAPLLEHLGQTLTSKLVPSLSTGVNSFKILHKAHRKVAFRNYFLSTVSKGKQ